MDFLKIVLGLLLLGACGQDEAPPAANPGDPMETPLPGDCLGPASDSPLVFVDVALEAGVRQDGINMGIGAEDWDGDGDLDVILAGASPQTVYFSNRGDGTFEEAPAPPFFSGSATGVSSPDWDGDGDPDLYISCGEWGGGCASQLYRNDGIDPSGHPIFTNVTQQVGMHNPGPSNFGGNWADYDRDGDLDLFQGTKALDGVSAPPEDLLYRNDGGTFVEAAVSAGVNMSSHSHQGVWLDYDEDGFPDLYLPTLDGDNHLLHNEGDGTFVEVTPPGMEKPFVAFAAAAGDFDNDGHVDLLVSGRTDPGGSEQHGLFLSDGAGGWTDASMGTGLNDQGDPATGIGTMGLHVADLDRDGYLEVIFGNGSPNAGEVNAIGSFAPGGPLGVHWVNRTEVFDSPPPSASGGPPYPFRTHGMVAFDYDGDGDTDLMMGNGGGPVSEPIRLWRNDASPANSWVEVELRGNVPLGVGARVRVSDGPPATATWAAHRFAWQTGGFNSSRPSTVTVGTGRCQGPYYVTVTWPDGHVQAFADVPARQKSTLSRAP
ncbi:MAG: hypothetical protein ACI9WU_000354 [Myxococcota bacterium]